ncbi:hypothetical protein HY383_02505 [Candidatus Daviesbacteria bacterium]|nr:hypothetical protein [Candidatus Daviesbacteria bacterium]
MAIERILFTVKQERMIRASQLSEQSAVLLREGRIDEAETLATQVRSEIKAARQIDVIVPEINNLIRKRLGIEPPAEDYLGRSIPQVTKPEEHPTAPIVSTAPVPESPVETSMPVVKPIFTGLSPRETQMVDWFLSNPTKRPTNVELAEALGISKNNTNLLLTNIRPKLVDQGYTIATIRSSNMTEKATYTLEPKPVESIKSAAATSIPIAKAKEQAPRPAKAKKSAETPIVTLPAKSPEPAQSSGSIIFTPNEIAQPDASEIQTQTPEEAPTQEVLEVDPILTKAEIYRLSRLLGEVDQKILQKLGIAIKADDKEELQRIQDSLNNQVESSSDERSKAVLQAKLTRFVEDKQNTFVANVEDQDALVVFGVLAPLATNKQVKELLAAGWEKKSS